MKNIEFELSDPYIENWNFEICIDRVDYENRSVDSKYIIMDKIFCMFTLSKLGVNNTERIISEGNIEAKEWLKLYANIKLNDYVNNWAEQLEKLRLVHSHNYPSLEELRKANLTCRK